MRKKTFLFYLQAVAYDFECACVITYNIFDSFSKKVAFITNIPCNISSERFVKIGAAISDYLPKTNKQTERQSDNNI